MFAKAFARVNQLDNEDIRGLRMHGEAFVC